MTNNQRISKITGLPVRKYNKKISNVKQLPSTLDITKGRLSVNTAPDIVSGSKQSRKGVLNGFRAINDLYDKIEYMIRLHPDANMAHNSMLRLAYGGGETHFFDKSGKRNKELETQWREACTQMNKISGDGLDGLINQFHNSLLKAGSLNFEAVVDKKGLGVSEVAIIHPKYIEKEYDKSKQKYIDYQKYQSAKVQLTDNANYFSALFDSQVAVPQGTLIYESAIAIIDTVWEFNIDLMAVVKRVGFPRNDITIDRDSLIKTYPARIINDPDKLKAQLREHLEYTKNITMNLEPTRDTIHYNDIEIKNTSSDNSRTIDARAVWEILDVQLLNGLGMMGIFLNRKAGVTETYGTVQFEIMLKTIAGLQRISKRAVEYIAQIWLASQNIQGHAEFRHKPIDYKSEMQKLEVSLDKQKLYRQAEEYEWIDKSKAALEAMDIDNVPAETQNNLKYTQYITKEFLGNSASQTDSSENLETPETQNDRNEGL